MPRLSIIIPCLGGAAQFDDTLVSVLQNRPAEAEVLVALAEPYDDPYRLAGEVDFVSAISNNLIGLINAALECCQGEVIHIVGCGLRVQEGWTQPALRHFDDPEVAAVSPIVLSSDASKITTAGVYWSPGGTRRVVTDDRLLLPGAGRLRAKILGPSLPAAFYRREVLAAMDGFDLTTGDHLADVEMALAIRHLGCLHVCEPESRLIQVTSPGTALAEGGFAEGRAAERLFWRHAHERGVATSLALHSFTVLRDLLSQGTLHSALASAIGRTAAMYQLARRRHGHSRLAAAAVRLAELAELRAALHWPKRTSDHHASANTCLRRAA